MKFSTFLLAMTFVLQSQPAMAFFSLMDTGELMNRGYHRITGETQFIVGEDEDPNIPDDYSRNGFNLNGRFSTGLNQESDLQAEFGVGTVDFYVAGFWKWIPFPDTSNQPAVGARFGITYADINKVTTYGLQATPLISKKFDAGEVGVFTPYAGLPIGLQNTNDDTFVSVQFVVGTQWTFPKWRHVHFLVEYGYDVDDAFNHFSLGLGYDI